MLSKLKYIPGAVPGKVGKCKAAAPDDIAKKHRVYEATGKSRSFLDLWKLVGNGWNLMGVR